MTPLTRSGHLKNVQVYETRDRPTAQVTSGPGVRRTAFLAGRGGGDSLVRPGLIMTTRVEMTTDSLVVGERLDDDDPTSWHTPPESVAAFHRCSHFGDLFAQMCSQCGGVGLHGLATWSAHSARPRGVPSLCNVRLRGRLRASTEPREHAEPSDAGVFTRRMSSVRSGRAHPVQNLEIAVISGFFDCGAARSPVDAQHWKGPRGVPVQSRPQLALAWTWSDCVACVAGEIVGPGRLSQRDNPFSGCLWLRTTEGPWSRSASIRATAAASPSVPIQCEYVSRVRVAVE